MKQPQSNLLSAVQDAQENGYPHDFRFDEQGQPIPSHEDIPDPKILEIIPCLSCGATLYLIASNGKQGTYVHHWEL